MKSFFKFVLLIVVLSIFTFSENSTITKTRTFVLENGKPIYEKAVEKLTIVKNDVIAMIEKTKE